MRFREIRTSEKITEEDERKAKAYLNIKPEKEYTNEEIDAFWNDIWNGVINN